MAIETLSLETSVSEIHRLQNSINHLSRSNRELEKSAEDDDEERNFYLECIHENEIVIESQHERIDALEHHIRAIQQETQKQDTHGAINQDPDDDISKGVYL